MYVPHFLQDWLFAQQSLVTGRGANMDEFIVDKMRQQMSLHAEYSYVMYTCMQDLECNQAYSQVDTIQVETIQLIKLNGCRVRAHKSRAD